MITGVCLKQVEYNDGTGRYDKRGEKCTLDEVRGVTELEVKKVDAQAA